MFLLHTLFDIAGYLLWIVSWVIIIQVLQKLLVGLDAQITGF